MFGNVPGLHRVPTTVYPHARDMRPGVLFRPVNDSDRVLTILSNNKASVTDTARLWCVVILASPRSHELPGALFPLEFDELVQPLRVEQPMHLSPVA